MTTRIVSFLPPPVSVPMRPTPQKMPSIQLVFGLPLFLYRSVNPAFIIASNTSGRSINTVLRFFKLKTENSVSKKTTQANSYVLLIFLQHSAVFLVAYKLADLLLVQLRVFFDEPDDLFRIQRWRQQLVFLEVSDSLQWLTVEVLRTRLINLRREKSKQINTTVGSDIKHRRCHECCVINKSAHLGRVAPSILNISSP